MEKAKPKNIFDRGDYKDYELQILKVFQKRYPKKLVLDNQKHLGQHSNTKRQIDIGIYTNTASPQLTCVIECKNLSRKVTLDTINSFFGFLDDIGVKHGIIVTSKGFTKSVEIYAKKKKIELKTLTYDYLKDYYYIAPFEVPDVFMVFVRYTTIYCGSCDITILYEYVEIPGMREFEHYFCPKCKHQITEEEMHADGNFRVVKIFKGKIVSEVEIEKVKVQHIIATRSEWDLLGPMFGFIDKGELSDRENCYICRKQFVEHPPTRYKLKYKEKNICSECEMSDRKLLIDYGYL